MADAAGARGMGGGGEGGDGGGGGGTGSVGGVGRCCTGFGALKGCEARKEEFSAFPKSAGDASARLRRLERMSLLILLLAAFLSALRRALLLRSSRSIFWRSLPGRTAIKTARSTYKLSSCATQSIALGKNIISSIFRDSTNPPPKQKFKNGIEKKKAYFDASYEEVTNFTNESI